jgi:hypothetical protein
MDVVWKHGKNLPTPELVQGAMAGFMEKWVEEGFPEELDMDQITAFNPRTPGIAEEMLYNYIDQRGPMLRSCEVVQIEQPFAVPLPNLEKTWYIGRLDKVVEYNGNEIILEHKTTALYAKASGFQSMYIEGWYSDSQIKGYQYGGGLYFPGNAGVWVDCALAHKTVHDAFRFVPVNHNFDMIREWLNDAQEWQTRMVKDEHQFKRDGHLSPGCFPKNENSCYNKYGSCVYLDICRTTADIQEGQQVFENYVVEKWEPFTTLGIEKIIEGDK